MVKNKTGLILFFIVCAALALRWYLMPGQMFFGPEQGRDMLAVKDIVVNAKLTLIGSKTDVAGIFHGPIFYYVAVLPFALSSGDPAVVAFFFAVLQSMSALLFYLFVKELTGKKEAGLIAAALFATSFLFIVYSRWLSNPPLSIPLSVLFMLFILRFIRGKKWYLAAAAATYGALGQAEFINFLLFGFIGLVTCILFYKKFLKTKPIVWAVSILVGIVSSFGTYILFDLRHDFLVWRGLVDLALGKSSYKVDLVTSIGGSFRVLFEQISRIVGLEGWIAGFIIFIALSYVLYRNIRRSTEYVLLAVWAIVPPVTFAVMRHGMLDQLYAGIISVFIILIAVSLKKISMLVLAVCIVLNVLAITKYLPWNYHVFFQPQQPGVRYSDELKVIDWVYAKAASRPFSLQAYTIPYFVQDGWVYLFEWYGTKKYGYVPDNQGRKLLFAVIQEDTLDPNFQKTWYKEATAPWGTKTDSATIGVYRVEEWML